MICISESELYKDEELIVDSERRWTVYYHQNKINGKIYVGITQQNPERRWQNGYGYYQNQYFSRAISKYGWKDGFHHVIYASCLTEDEAKKMEITLIKLFQANNREYGYNISSGGGGSKGVQRFGKDHPLSKPVYQYDLDGNFIRSWENSGCAEREIGIGSSTISAVARGDGNLETAGNYMWRYEFKDKIEPYQFKKHRNHPVCQIDMDFNLIQIFPDVYAVDKSIFTRHYHPYRILQCCNKIDNYLTFEGYYWCFEEDFPNFKQYVIDRMHSRSANRRKIINQYDANYNLVSTYESTMDAFKKTGIPKSTIKAYCGRGQANHGFKNTGYYWYYADDMKEGEANEQTG